MQIDPIIPPHITRVNKGSQGDCYETPWALIKLLETVFGKFTLDVCASAGNAKAKRFFTEEEDGLKQTWSGRVWCNPPFSMKEEFLRKVMRERNRCEVIAVLLPNNARETEWWRYNVWYLADEIITLTPRIQFTINGRRPVRINAAGKEVVSGVAYGSCIAIYRPRFSRVTYGPPREYILDTEKETIS